MRFEACVLAVGGTAATEQDIEAGAAADPERSERRFSTVIRIVTYSTIVLRQLLPFVVCRQSPSIAEGLTSSLS